MSVRSTNRRTCRNRRISLRNQSLSRPAAPGALLLLRQSIEGRAFIVLADLDSVLALNMELILVDLLGQRDLVGDQADLLLHAECIELVAFRLVRFDDLLQTADQAVLQRAEIDGALGDLTQGNDRVLVVVPIDSQSRAGAEIARALCRDHHQLESIGNLEDAVLDGYARHAGYSTARSISRRQFLI